MHAPTKLAAPPCFEGLQLLTNTWLCCSWLLLLAGHRMIRSPQQQRVAQQDTLALPVYIIEDLVRQRLKTNITR
jgi:hypothetical protein